MKKTTPQEMDALIMDVVIRPFAQLWDVMWGTLTPGERSQVQAGVREIQERGLTGEAGMKAMTELLREVGRPRQSA